MSGMVRSLVLLFAVAALLPSLRAQIGLPVVSQALPDLVLAPNGAARTIDLRGHFAADGVTGEVVQFTSPLGTFNAEMLVSAAPNSVANFLAYVNDAAFNNTVIHRSSKLSGAGNQIIQGGGYRHSLPLGTVAQRAAIGLEYNLPNTRGTLAMARTSALNSATSQWFINVHDNTTVLGPTNGGGYAVFGRVLGTGMSVVDTMAALPIYNLGSPLTEIPLRGVQPGQTEVQLANFVNFTRVAVVPVYPVGTGAASVLGFTSGSTNSSPAIVNAQISGANLVLTPLPQATGISRITIAATDTQGNRVTSSFVVGVDASGAAVIPPAAPVALGDSVTLTVSHAAAATGYQWRRNGAAISGATAATLALANLASADAGLYSVTLTTATGPLTTDPVIVARSPPRRSRAPRAKSGRTSRIPTAGNTTSCC
jgi:cyclophilin family peptidyl-prolyl cis-trans isomerase